MLVDVKTEILINTPMDATPVYCSVLRDLNRVQRLSDSQKKTCFNSSRGGRIQLPTPIAIDTHYSSWDEGCFLLASVIPSNFLNFKQTLPPGTKAPGFRVGESDENT